MKIAVLAHCHHPIAEPFSGGLEAHTALVTDSLVRRGHQVELFAKAGSETQARLRPIVNARYVHGAETETAGYGESILDQAMWSAVRTIEQGDFDAVLNNSLNPVPFMALADHPMLTLLHTPATLERTNAVIGQPGWRPGRHHAYAAVSEVTARDWRTLLPQVRCIPNGIDLAAWRARPGVRPVRRRAVWAARITPEKGLPFAIAASRQAGFSLDIGGPISDRGHFDAEIRPQLGPEVRYLGHLSHGQLPALYGRGSVFVSSPQWSEPFGLAMVEAMACGTPVAALGRGAAAEVVDARGGVVTHEQTSAALARAIREAATLDRHSVRDSVQRFDQHVMVTAYKSVLQALVDSHQQSERRDVIVARPGSTPSPLSVRATADVGCDPHHTMTSMRVYQ